MIQRAAFAAQLGRLDIVHDVDVDGDRARQAIDAGRS